MKPATLKDLIMMAAEGKEFEAVGCYQSSEPYEYTEKDFLVPQFTVGEISARWVIVYPELVYTFETTTTSPRVKGGKPLIWREPIPERFAGKTLVVTVREKV